MVILKMMKWLFGRKEPGAKLLGLLSIWHLFETVDLNRPELADKLQDFAVRLEAEIGAAKEHIISRAQSGTTADIDFIFDVLLRLPAPPAQIKPLPDDADFSWEKAEAALGPVARVVNGIRVTVQARRVAPYEREIANLRRKQARPEEIDERQAELRAVLNIIDQDFRQHLKSLLRLYELYSFCLDALAQIKSPEGTENLIARLCAPQPQERVLTLQALERCQWQPKTTLQGLNYYLAQAKLSDNEKERRQAEKELEKLISQISDKSELQDLVEPRLAEEGLTFLQAKAVETGAYVGRKTALTRFFELFSGSEEPAELKIAAVKATQQRLLPLQPEKAVNLLIKALDDLEMEVRVNAAQSLARWPENTPESARQAAMERLLFALRDGDLEVRDAAAGALNPKTYPDAGERLAQILLTEPNPNAREYAAKALGLNFTASETATSALIKALSDEDAAVRKAAAEALIAQGKIPTEPKTRLQFLCAKQEWGALIAAGKPAVECLLPRLRDLRPEIRLEAVKVLGRIRAQEAVKELCIALSDSNQDVRKAAAKALGDIGSPEAVPALKTAITREGFKDVLREMENALRRLT
ncbi:MAG: HEAT repeat domain-containing protein [candidate division WOR-3 bacterium]